MIESVETKKQKSLTVLLEDVLGFLTVTSNNFFLVKNTGIVHLISKKQLLSDFRKYLLTCSCPNVFNFQYGFHNVPWRKENLSSLVARGISNLKRFEIRFSQNVKLKGLVAWSWGLKSLVVWGWRRVWNEVFRECEKIGYLWVEKSLKWGSQGELKRFGCLVVEG